MKLPSSSKGILSPSMIAGQGPDGCVFACALFANLTKRTAVGRVSHIYRVPDKSLSKLNAAGKDFGWALRPPSCRAWTLLLGVFDRCFGRGRFIVFSLCFWKFPFKVKQAKKDADPFFPRGHLRRESRHRVGVSAQIFQASPQYREMVRQSRATLFF